MVLFYITRSISATGVNETKSYNVADECHLPRSSKGDAFNDTRRWKDPIIFLLFVRFNDWTTVMIVDFRGLPVAAERNFSGRSRLMTGAFTTIQYRSAISAARSRPGRPVLLTHGILKPLPLRRFVAVSSVLLLAPCFRFTGRFSHVSCPRTLLPNHSF